MKYNYINFINKINKLVGGSNHKHSLETGDLKKEINEHTMETNENLLLTDLSIGRLKSQLQKLTVLNIPYSNLVSSLENIIKQLDGLSVNSKPVDQANIDRIINKITTIDTMIDKKNFKDNYLEIKYDLAPKMIVPPVNLLNVENNFTGLFDTLEKNIMDIINQMNTNDENKKAEILKQFNIISEQIEKLKSENIKLDEYKIQIQTEIKKIEKYSDSLDFDGEFDFIEDSTSENDIITYSKLSENLVNTNDETFAAAIKKIKSSVDTKPEELISVPTNLSNTDKLYDSFVNILDKKKENLTTKQFQIKYKNEIDELKQIYNTLNILKKQEKLSDPVFKVLNNNFENIENYDFPKIFMEMKQYIIGYLSGDIKFLIGELNNNMLKVKEISPKLNEILKTNNDLTKYHDLNCLDSNYKKIIKITDIFNDLLKNNYYFYELANDNKNKVKWNEINSEINLSLEYLKQNLDPNIIKNYIEKCQLETGQIGGSSLDEWKNMNMKIINFSEEINLLKSNYDEYKKLIMKFNILYIQLYNHQLFIINYVKLIVFNKDYKVYNYIPKKTVTYYHNIVNKILDSINDFSSDINFYFYKNHFVTLNIVKKFLDKMIKSYKTDKVKINLYSKTYSENIKKNVFLFNAFKDLLDVYSINYSLPGAFI
uniref:Uncharacterized protein n=1 Tax=viral metagenome TaxID=1070528 RepID=A0A6C0DAB2_9ZZZZ